MDVTKSNFDELLPQVLKAIDDADFVAVDGEFTGLNNGPDVTVYDLPQEYYNKLRVGKMDYMLVQMGLCMFKYNKQDGRYTHRAYNFYIFPKFSKYGINMNFLCEAASLEFLSNNNFDFNKLIKEGISYLSFVDEKEISDELDMKYKNMQSSKDENERRIPVPDELEDTVSKACAKIEEYLSSDNMGELVLEGPFNGYTRKLIYQEAYHRFQSTCSFYMETKLVDGKSYCLVAQKGKSKSEMRKEKYEKEKKEINDAVGFSKVVRYLSQSKKVVVGHNMLIDICHIVNRFFVPLPQNYAEFKKVVSYTFPRLIDTKYMCNSYPFRDHIQSSVLDHLIKRLQMEPFQFAQVEPEEEGAGYEFSTNKSHEAGYDAYVTGLCFITMSEYLGSSSSQTPVLPDNKLIKPFKNRFHLMRLYDNAYVDLRGDDEIPKERDHVFHITFPRYWSTSDIISVFEKYGRVTVSYCNSTSAWVTLIDKEMGKDVTEAFVGNSNDKNLFETPEAKSKLYTIKTWHQYQEEFEKRSVQYESPASLKAASRFTHVAKYISSVGKRSSNIEGETPKKTKLVSRNGEGEDEEQCENGESIESDGAVLTTQVRNFLLSDMETLVSSETEICIKKSVRKKRISEGALKGDTCLKQLQKGSHKVDKIFEEPPWD